MVPVRQCVPAAVASLLRRQPLSPGKVQFAWRLVVGPAMARATRIDLDPDGVLHIRADDEHWGREVSRMAHVLAARLQPFLGAGVVRAVDAAPPDHAAPWRNPRP